MPKATCSKEVKIKLGQTRACTKVTFNVCLTYVKFQVKDIPVAKVDGLTKLLEILTLAIKKRSC